MAQYDKSSPYYKTATVNGYLDLLMFTDIPEMTDDVQMVVPPIYMHRPDLLAYDVYGDTQLWWVFAVRNKDVIKDPVYDLVPGQVIYLPKLQTIKTALGY